jgi:hypothetical protein
MPTHWQSKRKRHEVRFRVCELVWGRQEAGEKITKALFESVGRELGVSGTVAAEAYYYTMKMIGE